MLKKNKSLNHKKSFLFNFLNYFLKHKYTNIVYKLIILFKTNYRNTNTSTEKQRQMNTIILFSFFSTFVENPISTNDKTLVFQGIAKDLVSREMLYREVHSEIYSEKGHYRTQTNFFGSNNRLIATRNLDFTNSKSRPEYTFHDYRTGSKESVTNKNGIFTITYQENRESPLILKSIEVPEPAVVDGGFNYFVKSEWNRLKEGKTVVFNFISTARQDYYRFQLSMQANKNNAQNNHVTIIMEPVSYILKALLDPVIITYDKNTQRIVNYRGISNIKDLTGNSYFATLTYPEMGP